jgi:hypothetical protein
MKTIKIILKSAFLILILTVLGCEKPSTDSELIYIDLGTNFNNDKVKIEINNVAKYSETISTNQTIGLADGVNFDLPVGNSEIKIDINGITNTETFVHKKGRFLYISFDKENSEIKIIYPEKRFVYD